MGFPVGFILHLCVVNLDFTLCKSKIKKPHFLGFSLEIRLFLVIGVTRLEHFASPIICPFYAAFVDSWGFVWAFAFSLPLMW